MTIREQVVLDIEALNAGELEYAARLIGSLRSRPAGVRTPSFDPAVYGPLYREFEAEDRDLAENGMAEYEKGLRAEDGE